MSSHTKSLTVVISFFSLIIVTTTIISLIAQGYRIEFKGKPTIKSTGILSATSQPKSASIYLDDRLISATDNTINLPPAEYSLKIVKNGYLPWQKTIQIKKEVVYQSNAQLFRSSPDLKSITPSGAINPVVSPDGTKIVYSVASASAQTDNGLYLIELTNNPLPINRNIPKLIAPNSLSINWSEAEFNFSPNSQQIIATFNQKLSMLLNISSSINKNQLFDITPKLPIIKEEWSLQNQQITAAKLEKIPEILKSFISTDSAQNIQLTLLEDKILYLAKTSGQLPQNIITPPPAQSTQKQSRSIETNNYYVYDIKDDTNFLIGSNIKAIFPMWLPNSNNIVYIENNNINTVEYDSTNKQTLFSGTFNKNLLALWPDGNRLITLISPYPGSPQNLYAIIIK